MTSDQDQPMPLSFWMLTLVVGLGYTILFPLPALADWTAHTVSHKDQVAALCSVESSSQTSMAPDRAIQFTNGDASVVLCFESDASYDSKSLGSSKYTTDYAVFYSLGKGSAPILLHSDAEMMTWGMTYSVHQSTLTFYQYWGERRVKTYTFACGLHCDLTTSCQIEHLTSDVDDPIGEVQRHLRTEQDRQQFLLADDPTSGRLLNQLFVTAGAGDIKAEERLHELANGMDAGPAEIIGTFISYADDLKKDNCVWQ